MEGMLESVFQCPPLENVIGYPREQQLEVNACVVKFIILVYMD
jgi:hypothetical protein